MDCRVMPGNDGRWGQPQQFANVAIAPLASETHMPGTGRAWRKVCVEGQRVSTMKSVPLPVSPPSPLSEMMSEAPGDISSEIRSMASGGMVTRSSASVAFDAGPTTGAAGVSTRLPFADFLTGGDPAPGIDTTFQ